jgi:chromosomal replication initiation ATPase DnaA
LFLFIFFWLALALANVFSIPISPSSAASTTGEQLELFPQEYQGSAGLGEFIFGNENAVLQFVLQSVLDQRFADSPLVLYGDRGTGKTALSHAFLIQWRLRHTSLKSLHTNANTLGQCIPTHFQVFARNTFPLICL